jgi:staphylococcal nuclease domain-containing protein 1
LTLNGFYLLKPYAFEAREFLRKKLIGKEVCFVKDTNAQNVDRGTLFLGKDPLTSENVTDSIVSAGLVEVRRLNKPRYLSKLKVI